MFIADRPIETAESDMYNRVGFSEAVAKAILAYQSKDSLVIGVNGDWGSGKTSTANMIIDRLASWEYEDLEQVPVIIRINPWLFTDDRQIISQFFKEISYYLTNDQLVESMGKIHTVIKKCGHIMELGKYIPGIAELSGPLSTLLKDYGEVFSIDSSSSDLEKKRDLIVDKLSKLKIRLVIFVDDIDRLNNAEIRHLFQAIKALGNFPNTIYVLLFDQKIVVNALNDVQSGRGERYLEKIVNIPLSLPNPSREIINAICRSEYSKTVSSDSNYFRDPIYECSIFDNCISPFFKSIRDVLRLVNTFRFKYSLISNETAAIDLIAITAFEMFIPDIYKWIQQNKTLLCSGHRGSKERHIREEITGKCNDYDSELILNAIAHLFPYSSNSLQREQNIPSKSEQLKRQNIACSLKFDNYFSLSSSTLVTPRATLREIFSNYTTQRIRILLSHNFDLSYPDLHANINIVPVENREEFGGLLIQTYCEFPSNLFKLIILFGDLCRSMSNEQMEAYVIACIDKTSLASIAFFTRIMVLEEQYYNRMGSKQPDYVCLFDKDQLRRVESSYANQIRQLTEHSSILELEYDYFQLTLRLLELICPNGVVSCLGDFANIDSIHFIKLICTHCSAALTAKGSTIEEAGGWFIDIGQIDKYVDRIYAQEKVTQLKRTPEFADLNQHMQNQVIAFSLYCDNGGTKQLITNEEINSVMPDWIIQLNWS